MLKIDQLPKGVHIQKATIVLAQDTEKLTVVTESGKLSLSTETWGLNQDDIADFAQTLLQIASSTEQP